MSKRKTKHIEAYRTYQNYNYGSEERMLVINHDNRNWLWLPVDNYDIHFMIDCLEDPKRGICLDAVPPSKPIDVVRICL